MSTNYYASIEKDKCAHCGRSDNSQKVHIGKSSSGWCFALHVIPELELISLEAWEKYLRGDDVWITNECDELITVDGMIEIIKERSWTVDGNEKVHPKKWLKQNHAVPGPHGLARHEIDDTHCIGHGEGTWDLITGEFS